MQEERTGENIQTEFCLCFMYQDPENVEYIQAYTLCTTVYVICPSLTPFQLLPPALSPPCLTSFAAIFCSPLNHKLIFSNQNIRAEEVRESSWKSILHNISPVVRKRTAWMKNIHSGSRLKLS